MSVASPQPPEQARRPRPRLMPGRGPAAVLVVGLLGAGILVAFSPAVSLSALHKIHGDGSSLHDVAKVYVPGWTSPEFNPFVDHRMRALTLLLSLGYLAAVMALGGLVVGAIRGVEQWPRTVRVLAGFLPGYLMVLAPLQVLYAAVPLVTASWLALGGVMGAAVVVHRRALAAAAVGLRSDPAYRRRWLLSAGAVVGLLALSGLHRLQAGRNFMVTDSISTLLAAAKAQLHGDYGRYLLQWDQQSDEWVFNAPVMFSSRGSADYLFPLYATQFVGLASFASLVFGIVRTLAWRRPKTAAGLALAAVLAATPAIFPWFYISLVGGQNPAMWLGHPGRYIGIVAPFVALLLLGRRSRRATIAICFATLGLGFASAHVTVYVVVALGAAAVWQLLRGRGRTLLDERVVRLLAHAAALLALGAPLVAYGLVHRVTAPNDLAWLLLAGAVVGVIGAVVLALGSAGERRSVSRAAVLGSVGWLVVLAVGFMLSNNLTNGALHGHLRSFLAPVLPGYHAALASRGLLGDSPISGLSFPAFAGHECYISGQCLSVGGYLGSYGFLSVVAIAGWIALGRVSDDEQVSRRRAVWLLLVSALCASFVIVDFTGAEAGVAWIFTRFIEVPYYALLVFAVMAFAAARDRVTRSIGLAVIVLWTVIPVVINVVPVQLVKNADWLLGVLIP